MERNRGKGGDLYNEGFPEEGVSAPTFGENGLPLPRSSAQKRREFA
jgi:hypothetical protein